MDATALRFNAQGEVHDHDSLSQPSQVLLLAEPAVHGRECCCCSCCCICILWRSAPRKIIYDQDSVFIHNENLGDPILTDTFQSYVSQMDFEPVFCRAADPESKGMVENCVKYLKNNFLKGREYVSDERLNEECLGWLERTGNGKVHSTTRLVPKEEWKKKNCLSSFP